MSFTKVAPAGIGTEPGTSILIGDSLLHSTGIDIGSNTGIGVTIRKHGDATFTGIITAANISAASSVTATEFYGDGSNLDGVSSSGIGTALNDDDTNVLNKIYYVNQELSIGSTVTVNHPDTGTASYTHYQDLVVKNDADFIVSDGDTFIPDILGITTSTLAASAATGGRIRAGTITNAGANGAPNFPNGLTGTAGTFTGNLNVAGVLTYEDVTNVDSVGVITARSHLQIPNDTGQIKLGASQDFQIFHNGTDNKIIAQNGELLVQCNTYSIRNENGSSTYLNIESDGDVNVATGDIYFATAGKGIVLGTTSNTDAHTLDHYQEGTTGLTVKCGSVTVPTLNNTCKWTRVGNILNVSAWIRISGGQSASGISATDPVKITGFPFTTVGNSTGRTRLVFTGYQFYNVTNATALWGWMAVGDGATSTEHSLHWGNANWSGLTAPDGNNITNSGNYVSSEIYLNGHMFV